MWTVKNSRKRSAARSPALPTRNGRATPCPWPVVPKATSSPMPDHATDLPKYEYITSFMYPYLDNPESRIQSILVNRQQPGMVREVVAVSKSILRLVIFSERVGGARKFPPGL